jgi:hypothetical protein
MQPTATTPNTPNHPVQNWISRCLASLPWAQTYKIIPSKTVTTEKTSIGLKALLTIGGRGAVKVAILFFVFFCLTPKGFFYIN